MRIVHTCLRYPPATGGVETYVQGIVQRTHSIDDRRDVRVLTSAMRTHGPITSLAPELLLDDPPYIQRLHHAQTWFLSYPRLQALSYYIGHHRPDILHGYSFWYQPADIAAHYAKRHGIPFLFHPMYYEHTVRNKTVWQLYKKTIGRKTFEAADVVIVISPYEQRLIERAMLPVKRFALIPPGVDTSALNKIHSNPCEARRITGKIILCVSRLAADKGLDDAIRIMPSIIRTHRDVHLVIIGDDFGAKNMLEKLTKQLNISNHVHILGHLSREEIIGAFQHAYMLVHPSHYEAFGIAPLEALASGIPVVARNTSALPYVVPDGKAGILFETREELTNAVLTLLNNKNLRDRYGSFGKENARTAFSWDRSIASLLKLYDEFRPT